MTMKHLSRVVWADGMYLGPHHFQAQNRYFEDTIDFALSSLCYAAYGFTVWKMDEEALANGRVAVLKAAGLFRDGLAFQIPQPDSIPLERQIRDGMMPAGSMMVFLGIPRRKVDALNVTDPKSEFVRSSRYITVAKSLYDENTGRDERVVTLGSKNISLLLEGEVSENEEVLPIARVVRDGSGALVYDPNFIPPCLKIDSSPRIKVILNRLIEIMEEKSATLAQRQATSLAQSELASWWLLHAINSNLPELGHLNAVKHGHPEELYLAMARLSGALCTFDLETHPRDLPPYNHDELSSCFEALDRLIFRQLDRFIPTSAISIALNPAEEFFYTAAIPDSRCFGRSEWVLAVDSTLNDADLISKVPQLVKVCSQEWIKKLVSRALPGLPLRHLAVPPAAIPSRLETKYFGLSKSGVCWDHINETRALGVYVPDKFSKCSLQLFVVLEP